MPNHVTTERKILTTPYLIIHQKGTLIIITIDPGIHPISIAKSARTLVHSTHLSFAPHCEAILMHKDP